MLKPQRHPLPRRQQLRRLEHILDLAAIQRVFGEAIEIGVAEVVALGRDGEEIGPNVAAGGGGEFVICHRDVNAGLEGGVDVFDAVGR